MKLSRTFKLAIRSIMSSKARSLLTMLGIIIGVCAVIVIVGLGNGMEIYMTESFQSMGTNQLTVMVSGRGSTRSVSVDDMYAIADEYPELYSAMSPKVTMNVTAKVGSEELEDTGVTGVGEDYREMNLYTMRSGRFIQYADNLSRTKVCVVGTYIENEWFGGSAIGQTIKLNGDFYEIVGVLDEIGDSTEGSSDDCVFVPYTTAAKAMGTGNISSYSFAMVSEDLASEAKSTLEAELYKVFGDADAYSVMSLVEILDAMSEMISIVVTILTIIAGISLVVGGIGIMNIMLVSVSERTKEIGIRKALGAKRRHVLMQFVIEAGTTSAIGGVIGIILGYVISSVGSVVITMVLATELTITPSVGSVIVAFAISAGIGILFGYLPARKAAYLNPIDALRYD